MTIPVRRVGVVLQNLGGPDTLNDVRPYLRNLFSDPQLLRVPPVVSPLRGALAGAVSRVSASSSRSAYAMIGGGSPQRRITELQAGLLETKLNDTTAPDEDYKVYVHMRHWEPRVSSVLERMQNDRVTDIVVLPLYPQFSLSTTTSSLCEFFQHVPFYDGLRGVPVTTRMSWYFNPCYIRSVAAAIGEVLSGIEGEVLIFSAHGLPKESVQVYGDPYEREVRHCTELVIEELNRSSGQRFVDSQSATEGETPCYLSYQSRVGPFEWLGPSTESVVKDVASGERKPAVVVFPISFVGDHIETLYEIDIELRKVARNQGIRDFFLVPGLNDRPDFISALADVVASSWKHG